MGHCHDLNVRRRELPVNHDKRELPEQKPARGMRAGCPSLRSLQDVRQCPIHFSVKLEGGIRALLQIPVKRQLLERRPQKTHQLPAVHVFVRSLSHGVMAAGQHDDFVIQLCFSNSSTTCSENSGRNVMSYFA
jgi:hypothetical protein